MQYPIQTILGQPVSKSNAYRIITIKGHGSLTKTAECRAYEKSFILQCNLYRNAGIAGWFEIHLKVFFKDNRPDLDGCLKGILDNLQAVGAFKNDRYCKKIIAEKHFDERNPRIEFVLIPLQEQMF